MISQSFIKELVDRADIYEVINRRVPLQLKAGTGWACCPFHHEKSPSFSVNRERQMFHCFGCGESGNAIGFLMKFENLPFPDAVEKLAEECGVQVRYEGRGKAPQKPSVRLTDIMEQALKFYRERFKESLTAQEYVKERGLSAETIEKFGIGFAPDGWHNLDPFFNETERPLLLETGLQKKSENGHLFDFFRNRLMFPIRNIRGQVIAFSARTMCGEEPKYINTGETPIFSKGNEVFGLYEARKGIQEKKRAIVVEGQIDVIQLSQSGFTEACAPLGTAIRAEHITRLLKMTDNIIFSFDGDSAGRKAARRAMELSLPLLGDSQKVLFAFLPQGEDPDSLVKAKGAGAYEELLQSALPLSKYIIEALCENRDMSVLEDRTAMLQEASGLIKKVSSTLLRDGLVDCLAAVAGYRNKDELSRYFGIPVLKERSRTGKSKYFVRGKPINPRFATPAELLAVGSSLDAGSSRSLPPKADTPLLTVLRNFLRYPQLALEFEHVCAETLSLINDPAAQSVLRVLRILSTEDESGQTFAEAVGKFPADPNKAPEEKDLDAVRGMLALYLQQDAEDEIVNRELKQAALLKTGLVSARLETERVFLKMELERAGARRREITKLISSSDLTEAVRKEFKTLQDVTRSVTERMRVIDAELGEIILRESANL